MKDIKHYRVLGQTVDDAAGEAFDKVARLLNLPYPGGPEVSKLAARGNPLAIQLPRPMLKDPNFNFSFSGLKTAVLYYLRDHPLTPTSYPPTGRTGELKANLCASFQQAAVDVLAAKTARAVKHFNARSISLSGGVAANKLLRHELQAISHKLQAKFLVPPINLCTDNAEMIGIAAAYMLHNGQKAKPYFKIQANPSLSL